MKVKIKKLTENAVIPTYAHPTDAGMDMTATSVTLDEYGNICYGTDIAVEIPEGYVGLVFPRSSNSKKDIVLSNSVGVIDHGFVGGITFKFKPMKKSSVAYDVGDRIGQLIILPYPKIEWVEVDELAQSERGTGGYGSTGK